jgi:hypothetical protein
MLRAILVAGTARHRLRARRRVVRAVAILAAPVLRHRVQAAGA